MDDIQAQMNAILENPEMMEQIKAFAQNLNPAESNNTAVPTGESVMPLANIDIDMLQRISGIAGQANIDKNQKTLLSALAPYLSPERLGKLEKAMRASKMAGIATTLFGNKGR